MIELLAEEGGCHAAGRTLKSIDRNRGGPFGRQRLQRRLPLQK
ncbi:MAG: hypothetical protein WCT05_16845 [Lentisphaeria bacterium]